MHQLHTILCELLFQVCSLKLKHKDSQKLFQNQTTRLFLNTLFSQNTTPQALIV